MRSDVIEMNVFVLKWKLSFWKINDFQAPEGYDYLIQTTKRNSDLMLLV